MDSMIFSEINWRPRVFESLSFPSLVMSPDKRIVAGNQVFLDWYGKTHDDIFGKTCHEIFYGTKKCPHAKCPMTKVLSERKGQSILRSKTTPTGKKLWEDRVFSPILGDDGEVAYILQSVRDVTRVKNLEFTLKETEAFLEKIITGSPLALVAADRYGNLLLMNPAAQELFGYSNREAVLSLGATDLYPQGVASEIMKRLQNEKYGGVGRLTPMETMIVNSKGVEIPVEVTASIIYEDQEEIATMGIYTDLREKLAVENKLRAARARLAQSEKMASIGQLAAGVAHEINNPLTGILFYAEMKLESMDANDPEREDVTAVVEDVNRCKDIVKNLLAYSRQSKPAKDIIQLNSIIDQSLSLIRDPKIFNNIDIIKETHPDEMLVDVDRNQICQVVINLVMNAVASIMDSPKRPGRLVFRTYPDRVEQKVFLEIKDSGCGISKEDLPRIFEPFYTTKPAGKGTGLGLSTVYGLIHENNGHIQVKETSAQGTTFILELPLLEPSVEAEQPI
jgi:PAS domain S-box-containing protein